jgi:hypothetical protein
MLRDCDDCRISGEFVWTEVEDVLSCTSECGEENGVNIDDTGISGSKRKPDTHIRAIASRLNKWSE